MNKFLIFFALQICSIDNAQNTRFYTFLGSKLRPLEPEIECFESTPGCSCEPIGDSNFGIFGLLRDERTGNVKKLCFDPTDIPKNVVPESILSPCKSNRDCLQYPNAYCNVVKTENRNFYDDSTGEMIHNGGLCYSDSPSLDPLPYGLLYLNQNQSFSQGTLTRNGKNCQTHLDCQGAGKQKEYELGVNYCNKNTSTGKGVCQLFLTSSNFPCGGLHSPHRPLVYCGSNDTVCPTPSNRKLKIYCGVGGVCCEMERKEEPRCPVGQNLGKKCGRDEECGVSESGRSFCWNKDGKKDKGWCCEVSPTQGTCPDTVTYHLDEPECTTNNTCSHPGGICHLGHCCPQIQFSESSKKVSNIPKKSYLTNRNCSKSMMRNSKIIRGFCDENLKKIVILGTEMENSNETTELAVNGAKCRWNRNCKSVNAVCVRILDEGLCYHHPWYPKPPRHHRSWILIQIFGSFSAIFGFSTIMSCIGYKFSTGRGYLESLKFLACCGKEKMEESKEKMDVKMKMKKFFRTLKDLKK